jgi:hypothetical protein
MQLKGSLDSDTMRHFSQSKRRIKTSVSTPNNDAFEGLESLSTALYHADLNHQRIAGTERGNVLLELRLLDLFYHFILHKPVLLSPSLHFKAALPVMWPCSTFSLARYLAGALGLSFQVAPDFFASGHSCSTPLRLALIFLSYFSHFRSCT